MYRSAGDRRIRRPHGNWDVAHDRNRLLSANPGVHAAASDCHGYVQEPGDDYPRSGSAGRLNPLFNEEQEGIDTSETESNFSGPPSAICCPEPDYDLPDPSPGDSSFRSESPLCDGEARKEGTLTQSAAGDGQADTNRISALIRCRQLFRCGLGQRRRQLCQERAQVVGEMPAVHPDPFGTDVPVDSRQLLTRQLSDLWRSQLLSATTKAGLKGYAKWKLQWNQRHQRNKRVIREFFENFSLWTGSFKTIEGNFGCSVVSYFQIVKWLFLLNIFTFLCVLSVVILPQVLLQPNTFQKTILTDNISDSLPENLHMALECSQNYTRYVEENINMEVTSVIVDVFQGTGFLVNTHLFIGHYFNKTRFYDLTLPHYDMALAHLLTTAAYFLFTLILMVRYTATGIKESLLSKDDHFYKCFSMIFCGWDYTLSHRKAAAYKHFSLAKEINNELEQMMRAELWDDMSKQRKAFIYMKRVIVNIVSLACLVGCGVLIYYVVEIWKPQLLKNDTIKGSNILSLMVEYLPSVTITGLYLIIPMLFSNLIILEEYSPGTELRINIIRMVLIRLASLIILAVFIFRQISCDDKEATCGSCSDDIKCWETYVGQELYKLVVLDLIVVVATTFLLEFPRRILVNKVKKLKVFQQEFDLPTNVLNIIYSQTLCWWGAFYSPLIPAITVVKLFVFFYCKKVSLMKNQKPSSRSYKASKSNHFFMMVLMISFFLSVVAVTYTAGWVSPSQSCSPFRIYVTTDYKMFATVTAAIRTLPSAARRFFEIITSWFFYIILFVFLCLNIYLPQVKSAGSQKVIEIYHNQFALLEKDKQFLLSEVTRVIQGRS